MNVSIFFAGDFCSKPSCSRITVSDDLKRKIQSCDFRVVNFEVPLRPETNDLPSLSYERFFQNDDSVGFLKSLGFNLFQLANNHAFDWGRDGFLKTRNALGCAAFGAGTYDDAYRIKIVEKGGMKIGFFALSYAAYSGVFNDVKNHDGLGCAYLNDLRVNHDIIKAKKEVDYLFVLPHNGIEYIDIPLPETIARYRDFIDYGADGVIGTHPHCPQGWEKYKGKPIFYSLGNFLFNSKENYEYRADNRPSWYEGICAIISIDDSGLVWEVVNTRNIDNIRLEIDNEKEREIRNTQLCDLLQDDFLYEKHLRHACGTIGIKEMSIIDRTFHPGTLRQSAKSLFATWINKFRKNHACNDNSLKYLLSNDDRRNMILWTIKQQNNHGYTIY